MSSDTERVIMVALGLVAHCSLVFVPTIGEFHPTVGSVAFAYAALVITSKYDICPASWRTEHPNISRLIEFLVHVGVLNFAITTIWLPLVMFLTAREDIIAILACTVDAVLRLGGAAISWAESSEAPRQVAALLALGAAACAVYVTDFCSTVRNVLARFMCLAIGGPYPETYVLLKQTWKKELQPHDDYLCVTLIFNLHLQKQQNSYTNSVNKQKIRSYLFVVAVNIILRLFGYGCLLQ